MSKRDGWLPYADDEDEDIEEALEPAKLPTSSASTEDEEIKRSQDIFQE